MILKQTPDVILHLYENSKEYPYILQKFDGCNLIYFEYFSSRTKAIQEFDKRSRVETVSAQKVRNAPCDPLEIMTEDARTELIKGKVLRVQCKFYKGVE
jgi:hypothetical protein